MELADDPFIKQFMKQFNTQNVHKISKQFILNRVLN